MNWAKGSPKIERSNEEKAPRTPKGVFAIEKRRNPRYSVEFPLDYSLIDGETTFNGGLTADASEGGLLVYLPERIQIGALLRIEIFYTKDLSFETITATAKAVWTDLTTREGVREYRYGLQFQSIDKENLDKLKALLNQVAQPHAY